MKIQKVAVVLLLGLLLGTAFACGGGSEQGSAPAGWATYTNSSSGISIQYPQDWTKWETRADGVTFVTPMTDADAKAGVVSVSVYKEEEPLTLNADYVDQCILAMKLTFPDANVSESSATTLAGIPAHKFVYTVEGSNESHMKIMDIHTIKNNTDYIIAYITFESVYPNYLETAQQMIDSFRFD